MANPIELGHRLNDLLDKGERLWMRHWISDYAEGEEYPAFYLGHFDEGALSDETLEIVRRDFFRRVAAEEIQLELSMVGQMTPFAIEFNDFLKSLGYVTNFWTWNEEGEENVFVVRGS